MAKQKSNEEKADGMKLHEGKPLFRASKSEVLAKKVPAAAKPPFAVMFSGKNGLVEQYAFRHDERVGIMLLPDSVQQIESWAFDGCTSLTEINFPGSLEYIGFGAFKDCSKLKEIHIPESVTNLQEDSFSGCSGLTRITVDPNNPVYDSRDNCNAIIETATNQLIVRRSVDWR